jgi:hypothetical protein
VEQDFSIGGQLYEKTDGVAMRSPLSPSDDNFLTEDFEERAHIPLCWFR